MEVTEHKIVWLLLVLVATLELLTILYTAMGNAPSIVVCADSYISSRKVYVAPWIRTRYEGMVKLDVHLIVDGRFYAMYETCPQWHSCIILIYLQSFPNYNYAEIISVQHLLSKIINYSHINVHKPIITMIDWQVMKKYSVCFKKADARTKKYFEHFESTIHHIAMYSYINILPLLY